jgi:tetratricopeptide (TPR) repeat protein
MPIVWRNLAFGAFYHQKGADRAIGFLTRAINESPANPMWYDELVTYYEASGRDPKECLAILEAHKEEVLRNLSAPKGLVKLYNLNGEYDQAIQLLDTHHFRTWEGGRSIYWSHVDAHVLKALELMELKMFPEAIIHLERALEYPENLEVGKPLNDERNALIYYVMGEANEGMAKKREAQQCYEQSVACDNTRAWPDLTYYQGLALQKLSQEEGAMEKFNLLEKSGKIILEQSGEGTGIGVEDGGSVDTMKSVSEGYYLLGLAALGNGDRKAASELFEKAVNIYNNNLWARKFLESPLF